MLVTYNPHQSYKHSTTGFWYIMPMRISDGQPENIIPLPSSGRDTKPGVSFRSKQYHSRFSTYPGHTGGLAFHVGTDTLPPTGSWEHRWRHGHTGCVHRHWTDTACLRRAGDTRRTRSLHHCTHTETKKRRKRKEIIRTQTECSLAASLIQLSVACVENTEK